MTELPSDQLLHARTNSISHDRVQKSSSSSSPSNPLGANPRSCVTCRKRKVKCDKKQPCTNCAKAHIECVFPSPGRAPRKPRKPQDGELVDRIKRLESMVHSMGSQVPEEQPQSPPVPEVKNDENIDHVKLENMCNQTKELKRQKMEEEAAKNPVNDLEARFGRLVVVEGRSRYIRPSFWASLSEEVEDIKGILNDFSDDEEEDYPSPLTSQTSSNHQGYIFGFSSQNVDMLSLHPPAEQLPLYWSMFKENIDPMVKVLHLPTIEPIILEAKDHLGDLPKGLEVLLFAIYYGAITSLRPDETRRHFGDDRDTLLMRFRFGVEQALARADFLQTDEVIVLEGFVIFLISLRRNDDARVLWTLTGLVVRMAQTLGLHRDGSHYDLSPFHIEMRRRLWWQICTLDARASEDHGCDPTIVDTLYDTQMPLNINDADISPDSKTFPEARIGCTEMTFGLIRFEIAGVIRRIQFVPPGPKKCNVYFANVTLEKKEQWIAECQRKIEEQYLSHCDVSVPLYWVIATVSRLIMSKMWLMVYHPFQRLDGGQSLPPETRDRLFLTSLENIEYSLLLETESRTRKWGWLFRTYVQWHAIAFLLSELCVRTRGEYVDRAWAAIEIVTARMWGRDSDYSYNNNKMKSHLYKPLRKLMTKAQKARQNALAEDNSDQIIEAIGGGFTTNADFGFGSVTAGGGGEWPLNFTQVASPRWLDTYQPLDAPPIQQEPLVTGSGLTGFGGGQGPLQPFDITTATPAAQSQQRQTGSTSAGWQSGNTATTSSGFDNSSRHSSTTTTMGTGPGTGSISAASGATGQASNPFDLTMDETSPLMESPLLTDDVVNWTNWDDMVREFGMETESTGPNPGGLGFPSGVGGWF